MSDTPELVPELVIVEVVTTEHGAKFAEELDERAFATGVPWEALTETGVVTWPDDRPARGPAPLRRS